MNFIKTALSDARIKYRVNRTVSDAIAIRDERTIGECVKVADGYPTLVLSYLKERLSSSNPDTVYGALLVLERIVGSCNYGFHLKLAHAAGVQERILQVAIKRCESDAQRKAQRLARLTLLEYSRMFVDDLALARLCQLAHMYESRTHKSLMRSLNVQRHHVQFQRPTEHDIIMISPKEEPGSTTAAGTMRPLSPIRFAAAEVWPCHACTYLNAPSALRCVACSTVRPGNTPPLIPRHGPSEEPLAIVRPDLLPPVVADHREETAPTAAKSSPPVLHGTLVRGPSNGTWETQDSGFTAPSSRVAGSLGSAEVSEDHPVHRHGGDAAAMDVPRRHVDAYQLSSHLSELMESNESS